MSGRMFCDSCSESYMYCACEDNPLAEPNKIEKLQQTINEQRELLKECKPILEAVAHIGVDFGHGAYQVEAKYIKEAQELLSKLRSNTEPQQPIED